MNDGGSEESSRLNKFNLKKRRKNDEFAESLARIAVAQICESVGLQGFQQSALDTLSDITCKYIQDIGKSSNFYANLAGRTECNVFDIVHGLEDLGLSQGFVGASDVDRCLSSSGAVKEINQYLGVSEEAGFTYSVPPFPVIKVRKSTPSFLHAGETPPMDNIPLWLPCFPDPETYTTPDLTSIEQSQQTETTHDRADQDQKVIMSPLLKSEQRLASNGSHTHVVIEKIDNGGMNQANNPFLASPLEYGEKEVSLVSLPARLVEEDVLQNHSLWLKHVSALETFAPPIQGCNKSDLDTQKVSRKIDVERREAVQFKFHMSKKSLDTTNRHSEIENSEVMSWFADDDLKTRKEKILKETMEDGKSYTNDAVVN